MFETYEPTNMWSWNLVITLSWSCYQVFVSWCHLVILSSCHLIMLSSCQFDSMWAFQLFSLRILELASLFCTILLIFLNKCPKHIFTQFRTIVKPWQDPFFWAIFGPTLHLFWYIFFCNIFDHQQTFPNHFWTLLKHC